MVMKNKLNKHHKHKVFFVFRNFAFAFFGLVGIGLSIAIPTYITSLKEQNIATKAASENKEEETESGDSEQFEVGELLSII